MIDWKKPIRYKSGLTDCKAEFMGVNNKNQYVVSTDHGALIVTSEGDLITHSPTVSKHTVIYNEKTTRFINMYMDEHFIGTDRLLFAGQTEYTSYEEARKNSLPNVNGLVILKVVEGKIMCANVVY